MYTVSTIYLIPSCKQSKKIDWVVKLVIDSEFKETKLLSGKNYAAEFTEKQIQNLRKYLN